LLQFHIGLRVGDQALVDPFPNRDCSSVEEFIQVFDVARGSPQKPSGGLVLASYLPDIFVGTGRVAGDARPLGRFKLARTGQRAQLKWWSGSLLSNSAYFVGGLGMTVLTADNVVVVPIRSGIGLRLGANVGYLKFTPEPTWNPF
jgi:hypothetical protein